MIILIDFPSQGVPGLEQAGDRRLEALEERIVAPPLAMAPQVVSLHGGELEARKRPEPRHLLDGRAGELAVPCEDGARPARPRAGSRASRRPAPRARRASPAPPAAPRPWPARPRRPRRAPWRRTPAARRR